MRILAASVCVALLVTACSQNTRYEVLCFFFDGVPAPEVEDQGEFDPTLGLGGEAEGAEDPGTFIVRKPTVFLHPPYRDRRCTECHNVYGGKLVRPVEEGLCWNCHVDITVGAAYVHGPVAALACLQCHHQHRAKNPKLLHKPPMETCLQCHQLEDLLPGPHHVKTETGTEYVCIECHNPHAGNVQFFLKPDRPLADVQTP